jgi:hypothetical protein
LKKKYFQIFNFFENKYYLHFGNKNIFCTIAENETEIKRCRFNQEIENNSRKVLNIHSEGAATT